MTDSHIELTKRRVLAGILVIGLAAAAAGVGTFALFSDTETSSGNNVTAGTLDLTINSASSTIVNVSNVAPGQGGTGSIQVSNTGSLDGSLDVNVGSVSHIEMTNADAESDTTSPGDLNVTVSIYASTDSTISNSDTIVVSNSNLSSISNTNYQVNSTLSSGDTAYIIVDWTVPSTEGNDAQGDKVNFTVEAELNQQDSQ